MKIEKGFFWRIFGSMVVGVIFAGLVSEVAFRGLNNTSSRAPQTVQLVIPAGTSEKVASGQVDLAQGMVFVVGDTLVLSNQDTVAHTLGPLFVPPGSSARMLLDKPENLAFACSFNSSKYFGLDVREALTLSTRLSGILLAGIPMGLLFSVYSVIVWPLKSKKDQIIPAQE
jgi:hypothetical protein